MSWVLISSKVAACTSQPMAFNGIEWTPKNSWTSDGPQKQASENTDQSNFESGILVISYFVDVTMDWQ